MMLKTNQKYVVAAGNLGVKKVPAEPVLDPFVILIGEAGAVPSVLLRDLMLIV
jgi:hypothetical protein